MKRGLVRTGSVAALAMALCSAAAPAQAGTVYVPLAGDATIQGVPYTTRLWVSNASASPRRFTTRFAADGAGTTGRGGAHTVAAQRSMLLTDLAGAGKPGILELSGAPQLVVNAELLSNGVVRTALPVVSSKNVFLPKSDATVQGVVRSATEVTGLSLFNLGRSAATCSVSAFSASGQRLGKAQSVRLAARAQTGWGDVLGAFGQSALAGARVTATCDKPFYTFALVYQPTIGGAYLLPPGESTASVLEPIRDFGGGDDAPGPGDGPSGPGGKDDQGDDDGAPTGGSGDDDGGGSADCPAGAASCFTKGGSFFTTSQQDQHRYYKWAVPAGTKFKRVEVAFQMTLHKWDKNRNGFYTIFYMPRNGQWLGNGVGLLVARQKGVVTAETTLDLRGNRIQAVRDKTADLQPGHTYDVRYVYDADSRRLHLTMTDVANGRMVVELHETLQANSRTVNSNGWFGVQFSDPYIRGTDHVPMWATWRNLVIAGYR